MSEYSAGNVHLYLWLNCAPTATAPYAVTGQDRQAAVAVGHEPAEAAETARILLYELQIEIATEAGAGFPD